MLDHPYLGSLFTLARWHQGLYLGIVMMLVPWAYWIFTNWRISQDMFIERRIAAKTKRVLLCATFINVPSLLMFIASFLPARVFQQISDTELERAGWGLAIIAVLGIIGFAGSMVAVTLFSRSLDYDPGVPPPQNLGSLFIRATGYPMPHESPEASAEISADVRPRLPDRPGQWPALDQNR